MNDTRVECHFDIPNQLIDDTGAESLPKMFEQREIMAGTKTHSLLTLKETNVSDSILRDAVKITRNVKYVLVAIGEVRSELVDEVPVVWARRLEPKLVQNNRLTASKDQSIRQDFRINMETAFSTQHLIARVQANVNTILGEGLC
jgi:hypothetical protein